jgi:uncharacterized protein (DUF3820 family)
MNYEKFPFGKYKGHLLSDLPNTYIVYALETFDLPEELVWKLQEILLENLEIDYPLSIQLKKIEEIHYGMISDYAEEDSLGGSVVEAINDYRERIMNSAI